MRRHDCTNCITLQCRALFGKFSELSRPLTQANFLAFLKTLKAASRAIPAGNSQEAACLAALASRACSLASGSNRS